MQIQATPKNGSLVRQSREITESFPQYTGKAGEYWEKFLELLRNRYDTITEQYKAGEKKKSWSETLSDIKQVVFDVRKVDAKHVQRVVDAAYSMLNSPIVIYGEETPSGIKTNQKGRFRAINTLQDVDYDKKRTLKIVFTDAILAHYLGEKLTVEYDVHVKSLLRTKFGPILYQRCCMLENGLYGHFEMTEDDIRLALGIDTISDYEKLNTHIIREKKDLEITKGNEYDRFERFYNKVIKTACDEINELAQNGTCPFCVEPEVIAETPYPRRRGAPSKEYKVNFKIRRHVYDVEDTSNQIEDADAVEITPESIIPPPVSDSQVEMALEFSDENEQTKALIKIREQMTSILKDSKATHTKKYVNGIIAQIKGRLSNCPELPSMVLAWIRFSNDEIKANKGKASEVAKFIQANLKYHCQLFYKGSTYTGNKLPEYPPGYEPVIIEVSQCVDSSSTQSSNNIKIINNNNNGKVKPNSSEARRARLSRDANDAVRSIKQRPYIPKVQ